MIFFVVHERVREREDANGGEYSHPGEYSSFEGDAEGRRLISRSVERTVNCGPVRSSVASNTCLEPGITRVSIASSIAGLITSTHGLLPTKPRAPL